MSRHDPSTPPPQNLEAEMSLLGSMMIDPACIDDVGLFISRGESTAFYRPDHRILFDALMDMAVDDRPIDIVSLESELIFRGQLDQVGGRDYLLTLSQSVPSSANARYYAKIVRERWHMRRLVLTGSALVERAYQNGVKAEDLIADAERELSKIRMEQAQEQAPETINVIAERFVEKLLSGKVPKGLPLPWPDLTDSVNGLRHGEYIIVGARPSVGKTAFVVAVLRALAEEGHPVLLFSSEMHRESIAKRIVSQVSGVFMPKLHGSKPLDQTYDVPRLRQMVLRCEHFHVCDISGITPARIAAICKTYKRQFGIQCVGIDYLQLLRPDRESPRATQHEIIGGISRSIKWLARETDLPFIMLSQLNRVSEKESREPTMADLRESGKIEEDADLIMLLHRTSPLKDESGLRAKQDDISVIIAKQREGGIGAMPLTFHPKTCEFSEPVPGQD